MAVTKIIESVGRPTEGSDADVKDALAEARKTLRNIKAVDVVSAGLRGDSLGEWRQLSHRNRDHPCSTPKGLRTSGRVRLAAAIHHRSCLQRAPSVPEACSSTNGAIVRGTVHSSPRTSVTDSPRVVDGSHWEAGMAEISPCEGLQPSWGDLLGVAPIDRGQVGRLRGPRSWAWGRRRSREVERLTTLHRVRRWRVRILPGRRRTRAMPAGAPAEVIRSAKGLGPGSFADLLSVNGVPREAGRTPPAATQLSADPLGPSTSLWSG